MGTLVPVAPNSVRTIPSQNRDRVHLRRAMGREAQGRRRGEHHACHSEHVRQRVARSHTKELRCDEPRDQEGGREAQRHAHQDRDQSIPQDQPVDVCRPGAERHAHADFAGPLSDRVGHGPVDADYRKEQRQGAEGVGHDRHDAAKRKRLLTELVERHGLFGHDIGIDCGNLPPEGRNERVRIAGHTDVKDLRSSGTLQG
jgi:hypothetical protein